MAKRKRELVSRQALNGMIACECKGCRWMVSTPHVTGEAAWLTAKKVFNLHYCEDYPIREDVNQSAVEKG
jgi:hypothetical protein